MAPRTTPKNEEIRKESMQNIMNAAFSLIARQGYDSTSIAQIAAEAGVSKGLMYNYFESKEDLLEKLVASTMAESDLTAESLISEDPAETLRNLFEWFFKELRERPEYWRLITELTFRIDKFTFVHEMATEKVKAYTEFVGSLLQELNFPKSGSEAKLIGALLDGIAIQYLVVRQDYPLEEIEKHLIEKYCGKK